MPTFLHLAQKVAQQSGVIPGAGSPETSTARPSTVASSDAMEGRIVGWVRDAWTDIQGSDDWRFMRAEFDVALTAGLAAYTATDLGLTRFAAWLPRGDYGELLASVYTEADRSDEGTISFYDWSAFRRAYRIGKEQTGWPGAWSIDDADRIVLHPTPDAAKTYRLKGVYRRSAQVLAANADVPECPAQFHDAIVYSALLKADVFDDGTPRVTYWAAEQARVMSQMRSAQTPQMIVGGPLA